MIDTARAIMERLSAAGARHVYIVGGFVRDHVLRLPSKDVDIEVYGMSYEQVRTALSPWHEVNLVGESFVVLKVDNAFDVSLPRREIKTGEGHKTFEIIPDPSMDPKEACQRRDFTINSMLMGTDGQVLDYFGGLDDLRIRVLRATSKAFVEDPLRVLRAMQFAARFDMTLSSETLEMCRTLFREYHTLPKERIYEEWKKWATKSTRPSQGLRALVETGWDAPHPVFRDMEATPQDPKWHPEGNVWVHTLNVCDAAARIAERDGLAEDDRMILMFAALCHDFGKTTTTVQNSEGRWTAPGHAAAGVQPAIDFLKRLGAPLFMPEHVAPLVAEHMIHTSTKEPTRRIVRKLAHRLAPSSLEMWARLVEADHSGRPPIPAHNPVSGWMELARDENIGPAPPKPVLMGRHLLTLGWQPGPRMGEALARAFEAQLEGEITSVESGLSWITAHEHPPTVVR